MDTVPKVHGTIPHLCTTVRKSDGLVGFTQRGCTVYMTPAQFYAAGERIRAAMKAIKKSKDK